MDRANFPTAFAFSQVMPTRPRPTRPAKIPNPHIPRLWAGFATGRNRRKRRVAVENGSGGRWEGPGSGLGGTGRDWEGVEGSGGEWRGAGGFFWMGKKRRRCTETRSGRRGNDVRDVRVRSKHGSEWDVVDLYCGWCWWRWVLTMGCSALHMPCVRQLQVRRQVRLQVRPATATATTTTTTATTTSCYGVRHFTQTAKRQRQCQCTAPPINHPAQVTTRPGHSTGSR